MIDLSDGRSHRRMNSLKAKPQLSDFEVGSKIGAGNFGVIMRAQETKTRKEFAIKLINKQQIQSREHAEHIVREK